MRLAWLLVAGCGAPAPEAPPRSTAPRADAAVLPARPDARRAVEPAPAPLHERLDCRADQPGRPCTYQRVEGGVYRLGAQAVDPSAPGYDPDARPDEGPPHAVTLPPFRLARTEATRGQFRSCVEAGWCAVDDVHDAGWMDARDDVAESQLPVAGLHWVGAARLCAFLGGRLPTEAEWEAAARGVEGRRFPWGAEPGCGFQTPRYEAPRPDCHATGVGPFGDYPQTTPDGFVGMGGNVWEWVADGYAPYDAGAVTDPRGPEVAGARVQRGGGWASTDPLELRAAARGSLVPEGKLPDLGVRCARDEAP